MDNTGLSIFGSIVALALMVACAWGFNSCSCTTKAKAMDLKSSTWGPVQGCIVETKKGDKIDIERYRVVD